jgi:hypothetical protein
MDCLNCIQLRSRFPAQQTCWFGRCSSVVVMQARGLPSHACSSSLEPSLSLSTNTPTASCKTPTAFGPTVIPAGKSEKRVNFGTWIMMEAWRGLAAARLKVFICYGATNEASGGRLSADDRRCGRVGDEVAALIGEKGDGRGCVTELVGQKAERCVRRGTTLG